MSAAGWSGLVGRIGVVDHRGDVAERGHQGRGFCSAHPAWGDARVRVGICFRAGALGLCLCDPAVTADASSTLIRSPAIPGLDMHHVSAAFG
ncbi:hypothetical protein [Micromonospora psammae]|uniref:hypothetical protein n=1 Tax=Micromonospora sp. CPCC 205556 TaxID=3122398 RepID=UPI002FEE7C53